MQMCPLLSMYSSSRVFWFWKSGYWLSFFLISYAFIFLVFTPLPPGSPSFLLVSHLDTPFAVPSLAMWYRALLAVYHLGAHSFYQHLSCHQLPSCVRRIIELKNPSTKGMDVFKNVDGFLDLVQEVVICEITVILVGLQQQVSHVGTIPNEAAYLVDKIRHHDG